MKYAAAVLGIIIVALLAIFLIVNRGSNDSNAPRTKGASQLARYSGEDSSVSYTIQGKIVGDDQYRSIRITVSQDERRMDILSSYDDTIQKTESFDNTLSGYTVFLNALDRAGFRANRKSAVSDFKGMCPLGNRYIYTLSTNDGELINTWSDSCQRADGTFAGNPSLIRRLFQNQINDYGKLTKGVTL
jgi:hypothetical protein